MNDCDIVFHAVPQYVIPARAQRWNRQATSTLAQRTACNVDPTGTVQHATHALLHADKHHLKPGTDAQCPPKTSMVEEHTHSLTNSVYVPCTHARQDSHVHASPTVFDVTIYSKLSRSGGCISIRITYSPAQRSVHWSGTAEAHARQPAVGLGSE